MLICWLVLLAVHAGAQSLPPMSHQSWSADDGAPVSGIHQILQTADGYIWLATESGAVRFDGSSFAVFRPETQPSMPGYDVTAIAQDAGGSLWVGTTDGLAVMQRGLWRRIGELEGFSAKGVTAMTATDDDSLLVLTGTKLLRFDGHRFEPMTGPPTDVKGFARLSDHAVLALTEAGVFCYRDGAWKQVPLPFPHENGLLGLQAGPSSDLWAWSAKDVYLSQAGSLRTWEAGRDFGQGRTTSLLVDRSGRGWVGTSRGLFAVQPTTTEKPSDIVALRGESIAALFEDQEGNIWVGTESSGLHVLRPRVFRSEAATAGEAVTAIATASDGTLWIGTRADGLHTITTKGSETPVAADALTSPFILSLAPGPRGDVWAGTPDGLNHISANHVETFTSADGLPDDFVRSILVDSKGVVWAGTRRGLGRFENRRWTVVTSADGLGSDSIGPLLDASRFGVAGTNLWVGTSAGLSHIQGGRIENFLPEHAKPQTIVTALAEAKYGGIWVGLHDNGLELFVNGRFAPVAPAGLPKDIAAILTDDRGNLWLRGGHGVYRVTESELRTCANSSNPCSASFAVYGTVDGLPSNALAAEGISAASRGANGDLWFGTRAGLAVTNPAELVLNTLPPPVVIERLQVDDVDVRLSGGEVRVQPGHNRYVFDFTALSFTAPSKNRYRYKLEGFDQDWIEAGAARSASYTNLPAKSFVFRVQAANNDGVWNRVGASVALRVLTPFYRRWWFYLLCVAVLSAAAWGAYRLRVISIERRFDLVLNERNRVAREVHDTLAQDFVSVSLKLDLASTFLNAKQVEAAQTQLQETRKLVKDGLEEARQSIWNLRANTSADSLPARLNDLVKNYALANFRVRLKMGGAYHRVSPQIESEVFRIAQESLSNVERHAQATEAAVELHYEPTMLRLTVRDTGRGFSLADARALQGHYGLHGMQERAAAVGGEFTIQSEPGEGTRVTVLVSLLPECEGAKT